MINFWLGTLGALMGALHGNGMEPLTVIVGNVCFVIANAYILMGLARQVRSPLRWRGPLALSALFIAAVAWFQFLERDLGVLLMIFSVQVIAWDIWIIAVLLRFATADVRRSARFAMVVFAVDGVYNVGRFIALAGTSSAVLPEHGQALAMAYLFGIVMALAQSLAFILLIAERLVSDLRRQARTDGLTGLLNRDAMLKEGAEVLCDCARDGLPCALLMFDLDHFKHVNDRFGHAMGDLVLRHFADLVQQSELPSGHYFGRYGGEEFLLLLPGIDVPTATLMAEQLRRDLATTSSPQAELVVTTSIGVAGGVEGQDFDDLIAVADAALYRAKAKGRDCWAVAAHGDAAPPLPRSDAQVTRWHTSLKAQ